MNLNQIKHELKQHYGTENFYHGMNRNCVYTDGIKAYYELAQCYWLHSIIETEVFDILKKQELDTYYLEIDVQNNEAEITLDDYKGNNLYNRHIDFTDHPEGKMQLIAGYDGQRVTVCLPSEN